MRVADSPRAVSPRVLRMLDKSAANLKKGVASPPIHLTPFCADAPMPFPKPPSPGKRPS